MPRLRCSGSTSADSLAERTLAGVGRERIVEVADRILDVADQQVDVADDAGNKAPCRADRRDDSVDKYVDMTSDQPQSTTEVCVARLCSRSIREVAGRLRSFC